MKDYSTDSVQVAKDDDEPISVTEQAVIKKLLAVNTSRAGGPDDLYNWVLKQFADILAEPITDILNTSFSESKVWKLADIAPLPKGTTISDYNKDLRPISLTSTLSKIAEGFVIENSKPVMLPFLDPCQYGFIPRSSTTFALISMLHHWYMLLMAQVQPWEPHFSIFGKLLTWLTMLKRPHAKHPKIYTVKNLYSMRPGLKSAIFGWQNDWIRQILFY